MRNKIGIFGGTLNPIHVGHLIIAERAFEDLGLDKILIMPSGNPPHKREIDIVQGKHRADMVRLSIENNKHFEFSDIELKRSGYSYTSDTLSELKITYPDNDFHFILGEDSLNDIETWHEPSLIFKLAKIVVAARCIDQRSSLDERIDFLSRKYNGTIIKLKTPLIEISSSEIRNLCSNGKSIKYYVTDKTEKYIRDNKLYI